MHGQATLPTIDWHAADGKIIDCRFKDGVKNFVGAGNMVAVGGHWTGGTPGVNITGSGAIHLKDILFDSPNTAVIVHGGTNVCDISDCDFYQQSNIGGFTAVQKTNANADVFISNLNVNCTSGAEYSHLWSGLGGDDIVWGVNNNNVSGGSTSILGALSADGSQPGVFGWYVQGNNAISYLSGAQNIAGGTYTGGSGAVTLATTPSLQPGLWLFNLNILVSATAPTAGIDIGIQPGTATAVGFGAGTSAAMTLRSDNVAATVTTAFGSIVVAVRIATAGTYVVTAQGPFTYTIIANSTQGLNLPASTLTYTALVN
jgi:hypothetical protein